MTRKKREIVQKEEEIELTPQQERKLRYLAEMRKKKANKVLVDVVGRKRIDQNWQIEFAEKGGE